MSKDDIDVAAERAKLMAARQKKIDAEIEKTTEERETIYSQFSNPPSVRATDGGEPGTKERNPLEIADADTEDSKETGTKSSAKKLVNK